MSHFNACWAFPCFDTFHKCQSCPSPQHRTGLSMTSCAPSKIHGGSRNACAMEGKISFPQDGPEPYHTTAPSHSQQFNTLKPGWKIRAGVRDIGTWSLCIFDYSVFPDISFPPVQPSEPTERRGIPKVTPAHLPVLSASPSVKQGEGSGKWRPNGKNHSLSVVATAKAIMTMVIAELIGAATRSTASHRTLSTKR